MEGTFLSNKESGVRSWKLEARSEKLEENSHRLAPPILNPKALLKIAVRSTLECGGNQT
jgi:hypothetical protein